LTDNPATRHFAVRLHKLERFADIVEETLVSRAAELDAELTAAAAEYPEPERQEFFEHHAEDFYELSDELPTILRYSVLTGADAALEHYLVDTCETYYEVNKATVRLTDLAGTGIQRARLYLKQVARIQFPDAKPAWTAILRLRELRNCIMHANGYIPDIQQALAQWLKTCPEIQISSAGVVTLRPGFTQVALGWYNGFAGDFDPACGSLGLWQSVFPVEDVE
jgi:hypothetical protein